MNELEQELGLLKVLVVRRLREMLEKDCSAAHLDVARKLLADLTPPPPPARRAPPVVLNLPFPPDDEPAD